MGEPPYPASTSLYEALSSKGAIRRASSGEAQPARFSRGWPRLPNTMCRKEAAFSTGISTYTGMWKTRRKKHEGLGPALWYRVIPARTEHAGTGAGALLPTVCPNNPVWPVLKNIPILQFIRDGKLNRCVAPVLQAMILYCRVFLCHPLLGTRSLFCATPGFF